DARAAVVENVHDPFFRRLSPLDFDLRLAEPVGDLPIDKRRERLFRLFADAVTPWPDDEIERLRSACQEVLQGLADVHDQWLPKVWKFVRTDGSEEAGAAYTRHDAIVLPKSRLNATSAPGLPKLVAHELFHVISRLNSILRDRSYTRIGFRRTKPAVWPKESDDRRITNPDGTTLEHVIRIQPPRGAEVDAMLVTYSKHPRFAPEFGRRLFDYVASGLAPVVYADGVPRIQSAAGGGPLTYRADEVGGFFEQVGRNTNYIIHPDEILADNFALVATRRPAPADARLIEDLRRIWSRPE
ncbi:MAG: hypothetical protein ACRDD1_15895, partial [Planctomycetia bacterium]